MKIRGKDRKKEGRKADGEDGKKGKERKKRSGR